MTTTSVRIRARRAAAAVSSGSLALLALAALPPAAEAVSPTIEYACTVNGTSTTFPLPVVLDSTSPVRMTTGQSTQVSVNVMSAALSKATAATIAGKPVTYVAATLRPSVSFGGTAPVEYSQNVPRVALNDASPVLKSFSGTSTFTAPTNPGPIEVTAAGFAGTLTLDANDSTPSVEKPFTCPTPNGKPPLIDTIAVASSTSTTLTLARTTAAYGQDVGASAVVVSSSGAPVGDVAFGVDGIVTRARVDKDGKASIVLPDSVVGTHTVLATFYPTDVGAFVVSTSVTRLLTISKAQTKVKVPVTGRTTTTVTRVGVKATGAFGTVPTGTVRIKVKRIGAPGKWVKSKTLSAGAAKARLGKLAKGRYKVVVLYRGDTNHLEARKATTFRVTQG